MIFALMALLCLVSLALVLRPLLVRSIRRNAGGQANDQAVGQVIGDEKSLQVYRDQLDEIDRDQARGVLPADQAEAARLEVKRRMLALPNDLQAGQRPLAALMPRWMANLGLAIGLVLVILTSLGLYVRFGEPGLPALGYEKRLAAAADPETIDHAARLRYLELQLGEDGQVSDDAQRLEMSRELARRYVVGNEPIKGLEAMRFATQIAPENADLWAEFGEMIFSLGLAQGVVPPAARQAVGRSLQLDPNNPRGLFISALILTEDQRFDQALGLLAALRQQVPDEEPLSLALDQRMADIRQLAKEAAEAPQAPGPTAEDVAAAQDMSTQDRNAMIEGMVQRLADRLADEPDDFEGWARLANAYLVLGRVGDARAALDKLPQDHAQRASLQERIGAAEQN